MLWGNCGQYLRSRAVTPEEGNDPASGNETSSASDTPASDVEAPASDACESDNERSSASDAPASQEEAPASDAASPSPDTLSISRRKSGYGHIQAPTNMGDPSAGPFDPMHARNIGHLQELSKQYVKEQCSKFPIAFWRVFGSVIDQSKRTQSKVFAAVKPLLSARDQKVRHFSSSWAMHARHFFATV